MSHSESEGSEVSWTDDDENDPDYFPDEEDGGTAGEAASARQRELCRGLHISLHGYKVQRLVLGA